MSSIRTTNNPKMLIWARQEVGYTIEQAAQAIGISVEKLKKAEAGKHSLTLNQLRLAAEKYNCPFGYFYLSKPPHEKTYKPVPDYRLEPGYVGMVHYRLNHEIKKVRDHRLTYLDLINSLDLEVDQFSSLTPADFNNRHLGSFVRQRLGISEKELSNLEYGQVYNYWKAKIENDGVLVYETQYLPAESGVIGVAIYYDRCPIILIKRGGNYNARKLFTLLHEYAHLLKEQSAFNDLKAQTVRSQKSAAAALESECNYLAAEILVPSEAVNENEYIQMTPVEKMEHLANRFKVTYTTAAVCLRRFGMVTKNEFLYLLEERRKANEAKPIHKSKDIRIPRENIQRLDLGKPMFKVVLEAYGNGVIDLFDASKILNLRVKKIDKLLTGTA